MLNADKINKIQLQPPIEDQVQRVAKETLNKISQTASRAESILTESRPSAGMVLASNNSLTSNASEKLAAISDIERKSCVELAREPAIARLVVQDEVGTPRTIFITRATPLADPECASYLSPMGRLAALPVGHDSEVRTPAGLRNYEVVEKALLKPIKQADGWDAVDTQFRVKAQDQ